LADWRISLKLRLRHPKGQTHHGSSPHPLSLRLPLQPPRVASSFLFYAHLLNNVAIVAAWKVVAHWYHQTVPRSFPSTFGLFDGLCSNQHRTSCRLINTTESTFTASTPITRRSFNKYRSTVSFVGCKRCTKQEEDDLSLRLRGLKKRDSTPRLATHSTLVLDIDAQPH